MAGPRVSTLILKVCCKPIYTVNAQFLNNIFTFYKATKKRSFFCDSVTDYDDDFKVIEKLFKGFLKVL